MVFKNKIIRDTIFLTVMQLVLDSMSLLLNVFITKKLGASAVGIVSLTGTFLILVNMLANGNAFLCTSRLISEELGKTNGNPNKVLRYGITLCSILSVTMAVVLLAFGEPLSLNFFETAQMSKPIHLMALSLPIGAYSSCFKGYFNAMRKVTVTARADIMEFLVKFMTILIMVSFIKNPTDSMICEIIVTSIITGNVVSLLYFIIIYMKKAPRYTTKPSVSLQKYIRFALPIMAGGCITSALSSTNDALIPITLRQYGNSVSEALSQFGIFEAIVIPTLFFPSVMLCSLSGIVITESARAKSAGNTDRIVSISKKLIETTLIFSILVSSVLMKFGKEIGMIMDNSELAGKMISIISPVIPFIYLEIVLESLIKGLGLQGFSSLNYIAEYAIRISSVLIFVPHFGFYGIVISYYASNIVGNTARLIKIIKYTKSVPNIFKCVFLPVICAFLTMKILEIIMTALRLYNTNNLLNLIIFAILWILSYMLMIYGWNGKSKVGIVQNSQI